MAYKITEDCISCGTCESQCPNEANEAIKEGDTIYVIVGLDVKSGHQTSSSCQ